MCSKTGESEPFYFLLSTTMLAAICNADAEVIVESLLNPQTLDEWMMGIAVLVYVTVQVGSETALQRDSFSKEPYVPPQSNGKPSGMDYVDLLDAGWARCHRQSSVPTQYVSDPSSAGGEVRGRRREHVSKRLSVDANTLAVSGH